MEYIVTGAAGHIGNVLCRELLKQNKNVTALVLPGEDIEPLKNLNLQIVEGDITDRQFVFKLIKQNSVVYHLASVIDIGTTPYDEIYNVNVNGTKNIVDACIENKVTKLIYTSSVHVIDPQEVGVLLKEPEEFDETKVVGNYAKTKTIATKYVLEKARLNLLNATVVYPSGVIGPYDFKISELGQVVLDYVNGKLLAYVKGGYNFVDVRDVVYATINAETMGKNGEGYILSGNCVTLKEILKTINKIIGRTSLPPKIALWFVKMFASISNLYYKMKNKKPIFSAYSLYTLNVNSNFSNEKAKQNLNFSVRSVEESLKEAINWFYQNKRDLIKKAAKK